MTVPLKGEIIDLNINRLASIFLKQSLLAALVPDPFCMRLNTLTNTATKSSVYLHFYSL
jgi:hypothetical protein